MTGYRFMAHFAPSGPRSDAIWSAKDALSNELWLVMHRDLRSTPRVRLLFDWLAEGLSDYVKGRSISAPEA